MGKKKKTTDNISTNTLSRVYEEPAASMGCTHENSNPPHLLRLLLHLVWPPSELPDAYFVLFLEYDCRRGTWMASSESSLDLLPCSLAAALSTKCIIRQAIFPPANVPNRLQHYRIKYWVTDIRILSIRSQYHNQDVERSRTRMRCRINTQQWSNLKLYSARRAVRTDKRARCCSEG